MICSSSSVKTAIEINLFAGGLRKSKDVIMQIKRYQLHYRCYLEQFYSSEVNCFSIEVINSQQRDNNENNHSRILAVRSHQVFCCPRCVDNCKVLFYNLAGTQSQLVQLYVNYS